MERAVAAFVEHYNHRRYHESLDSVSFDWEKSWLIISVSRALSAPISGVVLARRAASARAAGLELEGCP